MNQLRIGGPRTEPRHGGERLSEELRRRRGGWGLSQPELLDHCGKQRKHKSGDCDSQRPAEEHFGEYKLLSGIDRRAAR